MSVRERLSFDEQCECRCAGRVFWPADVIVILSDIIAFVLENLVPRYVGLADDTSTLHPKVMSSNIGRAGFFYMKRLCVHRA